MSLVGMTMGLSLLTPATQIRALSTGSVAPKGVVLSVVTAAVDPWILQCCSIPAEVVTIEIEPDAARETLLFALNPPPEFDQLGALAPLDVSTCPAVPAAVTSWESASVQTTPPLATTMFLFVPPLASGSIPEMSVVKTTAPKVGAPAALPLRTVVVVPSEPRETGATPAPPPNVIRLAARTALDAI